MEVCTDGAETAPYGRADQVVVLLRRVGVVVGVLFGFGLIAVMVADRAAADEQDAATDSTSENELLGAVTEPVTEDVVAPLADTLAPVAPVVRAVAEPVVAAVEPVTEPVLELAAPITEPVLAAVAPVADPPVDEVTREDKAVPVDRAPPAPAVTPTPDPEWTPPVIVRRAIADSPEPAALDAAPSAPSPDVPAGPVHHAVTGGGVASGAGGWHNADGLASAGNGVGQVGGSSGRSPPGAITWTGRFAYDDRDHPR